jgi:hypothetical protein
MRNLAHTCVVLFVAVADNFHRLIHIQDLAIPVQSGLFNIPAHLVILKPVNNLLDRAWILTVVVKQIPHAALVRLVDLDSEHFGLHAVLVD